MSTTEIPKSVTLKLNHDWQAVKAVLEACLSKAVIAIPGFAPESWKIDEYPSDGSSGYGLSGRIRLKPVGKIERVRLNDPPSLSESFLLSAMLSPYADKSLLILSCSGMPGANSSNVEKLLEYTHAAVESALS